MLLEGLNDYMLLKDSFRVDTVLMMILFSLPFLHTSPISFSVTIALFIFVERGAKMDRREKHII